MPDLLVSIVDGPSFSRAAVDQLFDQDKHHVALRFTPGLLAKIATAGGKYELKVLRLLNPWAHVRISFNVHDDVSEGSADELQAFEMPEGKDKGAPANEIGTPQNSGYKILVPGLRAPLVASLPRAVVLSHPGPIPLLFVLSVGGEVIYGNPVSVDVFREQVDATWAYFDANEAKLAAQWDAIRGKNTPRLMPEPSSGLVPMRPAVPKWDTFRKRILQRRTRGLDGSVGEDDLIGLAVRIADATGFRPQDVLALWAKEGDLATLATYTDDVTRAFSDPALASAPGTQRMMRVLARSMGLWLAVGSDGFNHTENADKGTKGEAGSRPDIRKKSGRSLGQLADLHDRAYTREYARCLARIESAASEAIVPSAEGMLEAFYRATGLVRSFDAGAWKLVAKGAPAFTYSMVLSMALRLRAETTDADGLPDAIRASFDEHGSVPLWFAEMRFHGGVSGARRFYNEGLPKLVGPSHTGSAEDAYQALAKANKRTGSVQFVLGFFRYRARFQLFDNWFRESGWTRRHDLFGALPAEDPFYGLDPVTP